MRRVWRLVRHFDGTHASIFSSSAQNACRLTSAQRAKKGAGAVLKAVHHNTCHRTRGHCRARIFTIGLWSSEEHPDADPEPANPQAEQADDNDQGTTTTPTRPDRRHQQNTGKNEAAETRTGPPDGAQQAGRRDQSAALNERISDEGGAHTTQALPGSDQLASPDGSWFQCVHWSQSPSVEYPTRQRRATAIARSTMADCRIGLKSVQKRR